MSHRPKVSIITPARNASATLVRTIDCIRVQTFTDWQHIIVLDGPSDEDQVVADANAELDTRISVIRQAAAGASSARNAGIAAANGEWLLFLDADDTIHRRFLERMLGAAAETGADLVTCGYRRLDASGRVISKRSALRVDESRRLAIPNERPPGAIHSFLVRTQIVLDVGGFDIALRTNEDWDLWRRVFPRAKAASLSGYLSDYWSSTGSLTQRGVDMIHDAATVRQRVAAELDDGKDPLQLQLETLLWNGGMAIGKGENPEALLALALPLTELPHDRSALVAAMLEGLSLGLVCKLRALIDRWDQVSQRVSAFLSLLGSRVGYPDLALGLAIDIALEVVRMGALKRPTRIEPVYAVPVTPMILLRGIKAPDWAEALVLKVPLVRPRSVFTFVVPICTEQLAGTKLRRTIVRQLADRLTARIVASSSGRPIADYAARRIATLRRALRRGVRPLLNLDPDLPPVSNQEAGELTPGGGPAEDWDTFYGTEDPWNYQSAYEQLKYQRTLDLIGPMPQARALELACAEGIFTRMLAENVSSLLATDISTVALERAGKRCAGLSNVEFRMLDFFNAPIGGPWDLIVSSEVLYYMGDEGHLPDFADRIAAALAPEGLFAHAHAFEVTDDPSTTGLDWGDPFSAHAICKVFLANRQLERVRALKTDLYLIEVYRKVDPARGKSPPCEAEVVPLGTELDRSVAAWVVWNGAIRTRPELEETTITSRLPVLMYHSIAEDGSPHLAQWRTTPRDFEHQLRFLRRRGFCSVDLAEWDYEGRRHGVLRGRPILITFDDGYRDFHETALPILERNGFSAQMFVVAGKVGGTADWDAQYAPPLRLMDWDMLRDCRMRGVGFGSHLFSHSPADLLTTKNLLGEARASKEMLERELGTSITSVAPPFGALDDRVVEVCRIAGYDRLFTVEPDLASVWAGRMRIPRLEVYGGLSIDAFAEMLELPRDEHATPQDLP